MTHVSYNYETWHSYTLTKEDSENILLATAFSHQKSTTFVISRNTDLDAQFLRSLKVFLINMVETLMILDKLATLGLLKIKVF